MTTDHLPGRTFYNQGEEWLYFSGTAYLGIPHDVSFRTWLLEGMDRYGSNFGGSRLSLPRLAIFAEAETRLAEIAGTEAALVVSSGSLAGQLAVKVLSERRDAFFAPGSHPAIHGRSGAYGGTFAAWAEHVLEALHRDRRPAVLFSNAFDPLRVATFDFSWLADLPRDAPVTLVLDDSHALGVIGAEGSGLGVQLDLPEGVERVVVGSLGKAFGIPGGVILGSRALVKTIWRHPFFGGASPAPPAYLHAFLRSQALYRHKRAALRVNTKRLEQMIGKNTAFRRLPDFPVFCADDPALADHLAEERILVSSFPYPTPLDERLTRIVLNSCHTDADIGRLAAVVRSVS